MRDESVDMVFADPPYFLSNGGVTCVGGRVVRVDKGNWDKSQGITGDHNFNLLWLEGHEAGSSAWGPIVAKSQLLDRIVSKCQG